ncbi:cobyrinate a,c-diamide synthase [Halogeometricum borinquense]|uniref:Cobyrinate a,c-diamide synthase n=1 Tax=Halogeometricum borinquense TaxID=60847 RepID=A0A6C0UDK4_9EURY|nr:cobyrinate a,c-diamide synthase [Halogeometricum borinquense]QIB73250.1 cobyrinate a,c-diamide synthase [Halogeometricum borinquense]QIQ77353.1 cobyrinate a,c-diamide synthase [Halogeometricum borinquense]
MTDTPVPADLPGLVLAGTASGVGKTVATLAVCRALEREGHTPVAAKAGPDFIDPSHHAATLGRPSRTLDPWLAGDDGLERTYARGATDGDVCVVEGMMGLYDGDVSTAAVAAKLDLPIVLVVDATTGMESIAATALGFRAYADRMGYDVDVAGLLAARARGGRHEEGIKSAIPVELHYVGRTPPLDGLEVPERHLGLHCGDESPVDDDALDAAARHVDTTELLALARRPRVDAPPERPVESTDVTVAVATDDAFRFVYPSVREHLAARATVEPFAPVAGDDLPDCDAVYLPGGYPERHTEAIAESPTLSTIAERAADGLPVFGECGGLMVLGESLTTAEGETYDMAGVLPVSTHLTERPVGLDHVGLRARHDSILASEGETVRGHEFHYSAATAAPDARYAFEVVRGAGLDGANDGLTEYRTLGTYTHFHAESGAFDAFVESAGR